MSFLFDNIVGILVIVGLVALYIVSYVMNKRTPVPEECRDIAKDAACKSCNNFACSHKG